MTKSTSKKPFTSKGSGGHVTKHNLKKDAEKLLGTLPAAKGVFRVTADWSEDDAKLSPFYRLAGYVFRNAEINRKVILVKGKPAHQYVGGELAGYIKKEGKCLVKKFNERFPEFAWGLVAASDFSERAALELIKNGSFFWLIDGNWVSAAFKDIKPHGWPVALPGSPASAFAQILSGTGPLAGFVKESFVRAKERGLEVAEA